MSESQRKNYKLSLSAIETLRTLKDRLSAESRINISMTKALELAIFYASDKTFSELMGVDK